METQKSHHSGKSIPNYREHVQKNKRAYPTTGSKHVHKKRRAQPTAGKKFALESQNRRKEKNIDPVIEYTYTLRGTSR